MAAHSEALDLFWGELHVGRLHNTQPLQFDYTQEWLANNQANSLSPQLPLTQQRHSGDSVLAYFENLLPEGELRRYIELRHHTTTIFGLLKSIGGDTASGYTLLPKGETPRPASYRKTDWEAINDFLHNETQGELTGQFAPQARISLAGAQNKLLLMVLADGSPALPEGAAPSSHILKPDIRGLKGVWCSALNETLCMQLASKLELGVAEATLQPETRACLVKRYDRFYDSRGHLQRYHQLDLCQLAGTPSTLKYESDGGPSILECRQLIQKAGAPAKDLRRLTQWIFFNLFIGNNDSHAKNLSILHTPQGVQLAPFYDLMCTTLYSGLSNRFAFRVAGIEQPGSIERHHIESLAQALGFRPAYFMRIGTRLADDILSALPTVTHSLQEIALPGTEHVLLERLSRCIKQNCQKMTKRWSA